MEELGGPSRERLHSGSKGEAEEEALSCGGGSTEFCRFLITCAGFYWATLFLGHRSGSALTSMHKLARQD